MTAVVGTRIVTAKPLAGLDAETQCTTTPNMYAVETAPEAVAPLTGCTCTCQDGQVITDAEMKAAPGAPVDKLTPTDGHSALERVLSSSPARATNTRKTISAT